MRNTNLNKKLNVRGGAPIEQFVGLVAYILFIAFFGFLLYISIASKSDRISYADDGLTVRAQGYLREFSAVYYKDIVEAASTKNQKELDKKTKEFFTQKLETQTRGWMIVFKNSDGLLILNRAGVNIGSTVLAAESYIPLQTGNKDYINLELHLGQKRRKGKIADYDLEGVSD